MGTLEFFVRFISGLFLLMMNGVFVTTEFAMTRLRQFDEEEFKESSSLRLAWRMTEQLEIYLTACQVGITVTSILLGVVFEPAVTQIIHPLTNYVGLSESKTAMLSIILSVLVIQLMHTVWGEQSPTYLGVERPKMVVGYFAPVLYGWTYLSYPLIFVGDSLAKMTLGIFGIALTRSWTSEDSEVTSKVELKRQMGELLSQGELSHERQEEIINALEIDYITTETIMNPRDSIEYLSTDDTLDRNLSKIADRGLSRFPLVRNESIDHCVGVIYVPALFSRIDEIKNDSLELDDVAVEIMTVEPNLSVSRLVDRFQEEKQEIALVEDGNDTIGLVTATDAFEAIIGELKDPLD